MTSFETKLYDLFDDILSLFIYTPRGILLTKINSIVIKLLKDFNNKIESNTINGSIMSHEDIFCECFDEFTEKYKYYEKQFRKKEVNSIIKYTIKNRNKNNIIFDCETHYYITDNIRKFFQRED